MKNIKLGYNNELEQYRQTQGLDAFEIGRIALEHKERYILKTDTDEYDAELMGNLRFTANDRYDYPAVGDWVAFMPYDDNKALIHHIYPRHSIIERKAVGKSGQVQIIATNINFGLIVQAVDRDFNINRLERYITICHSSKVTPIIVLSKIDLIDGVHLQEIKTQIQERIHQIEIICVSSQTVGYNTLEQRIEQGKTYCLLGSSGVGKSTLLNGLAGKSEMKTSDISTAVNKGKHTTTHRELIVMNNGGIIIDNPGMREVGITDTTNGLEMTFDTINNYALQCKYSDCTHEHEDGCAVLEAISEGEIDQDAYTNFRKMEKEKMHFESDSLDRKQKDKNLGKMIRDVKKIKKQMKY